MSDNTGGGSGPTNQGSSAAAFDGIDLDAINQAADTQRLDDIGITDVADPEGGPLDAFDPTKTIAPGSLEEGLKAEQLIDINALRDTADVVNANLQDLQPLLAEEQTRRATAEGRGDDLFEQLNAFLAQQGENLGQAGQITPEQKAAIAEVAEQQIASGSADINAQLQQSLETLREESGAGRGLRFTDTPIFDVAQDVTSSSNRDLSRLISGARGQQAQSELALPFQADAANLAEAGQFGSFLTNQQSFQDQLAQQAFKNRALLFGQSVDTSLGLADRTIGFGEQLLQRQQQAAQLAATKAGQPSTTDKLLQAVIGGGATALFTSDENVKHNVATYDESNVLEKLADMQIDTWHYDEDQGLGTEKHLGPMAQEFKRVFGVGDGKTIAMVDVVGVMLASQKALAKEALSGR